MWNVKTSPFLLCLVGPGAELIQANVFLHFYLSLHKAMIFGRDLWEVIQFRQGHEWRLRIRLMCLWEDEEKYLFPLNKVMRWGDMSIWRRQAEIRAFTRAPCWSVPVHTSSPQNGGEEDLLFESPPLVVFCGSLSRQWELQLFWGVNSLFFDFSDAHSACFFTFLARFSSISIQLSPSLP